MHFLEYVFVSSVSYIHNVLKAQAMYNIRYHQSLKFENLLSRLDSKATYKYFLLSSSFKHSSFSSIFNPFLIIFQSSAGLQQFSASTHRFESDLVVKVATQIWMSLDIIDNHN